MSEVRRAQWDAIEAQWDAIELATARRTRVVAWVLGTAAAINATLLVGVLVGVVGVTATGSWP